MIRPPKAAGRGRKALLATMARWGGREAALRCPSCGSGRVVLSCNSFYGAATPWSAVSYEACGHGERIERIDLET